MSNSKYDVLLNKVIDDTMVQFPIFARKIMFATKSKNIPISSNMQLRLLEGLMVGPMKPSDISYLQSISRPNVTTLISKLIEGGFAQRYHDENDRRVIYVTITEKGKQAVLRNRKIVKGFLIKLFDQLDEDEIQGIFAAMDKFQSFLVKMNSII